MMAPWLVFPSKSDIDDPIPQWLGCSLGVRPRIKLILDARMVWPATYLTGQDPCPFLQYFGRMLRLSINLNKLRHHNAAICSNMQQWESWDFCIMGRIPFGGDGCPSSIFAAYSDLEFKKPHIYIYIYVHNISLYFSHLDCCSFPLPKLSELTLSLKRYTETYVF